MAKKKFLKSKRNKQRFTVKGKRTGFKKSAGLDGVQPVFGARRDAFASEYKHLLQEQDRFKRRMYFAAFFAKQLQKIGVDAILVGGAAVELYTHGQFETADMDFAVTDAQKGAELLKELGFERKDSVWLNTGLDIIVDVSGEGYSGDVGRVRLVNVRNYELKVAGVEDLIVNRLYSAKFWKSNPQRDLEEATALLSIFAGSINDVYLDTLAKKNDIEDFVKIVKERALK